MAWLWPLVLILVPLAFVGLIKLWRLVVALWDAVIPWLGGI